MFFMEFVGVVALLPFIPLKIPITKNRYSMVIDLPIYSLKSFTMI